MSCNVGKDIERYEPELIQEIARELIRIDRERQENKKTP